MNYALKYGLRPADRIIEPIFQTGLTKHHAIYLGQDRQGREWIAENYKFGGVRLVNAQDYFKKGKLIKRKKFTGTNSQRIAAVKRALSQLGKPYDLIDFNCEHYAEYVQSGVARSSQVENVADLVKTVAAAAAFIGFIHILSND